LGVLLVAALIGWYGFLKPAPPPISDTDRARTHLIPLPVKMEYGNSNLHLDQGLAVDYLTPPSPRLERGVRRIFEFMESQVDFKIEREVQPNLEINVKSVTSDYPKLGVDESYTIEVSEDKINIKAHTDYGALYALETLVQLMEYGDGSWVIPEIVLEDRPRYPWRGLMVDVCRHWVPKEVILRILDGMASVKMNVLHLHLTEYQGFRIESKKYPKLHELGSEGDFYSQDDIKEIVEFAADRGIRVVPEFDLPGHSTSWFVGYPELASAPGPYKLDSIIGILEPVMDPTREEVYDFLDGFFEEMTGLFPDDYIHIGGDEINAKHWKENQSIQQFMKKNEFLDEHALQAYFNQRLHKILQDNNKKMMGWDEIIHPDLPKEGVAVQSWRSPASLWEAARTGNKALLSSGYYLDYKQPAAYHYGVDPLVIPGAIDIDIDSSNWKSWDVTMYFNETEIKGALFLFGSEEEQGLMSFMEANQGFVPTIDGNNLTFSHGTNFGEVNYDLLTEGDSINGVMSIAVFNLQLKGKRSGGTDMEGGIALPDFKKIEPLSPEQQMNILGGEACMWSEMVDKITIESRIWPRASAIAEKLWSPQQLTADVDDFNRRMLWFDGYLIQRGSEHQENTRRVLKEIVAERDLENVMRFVQLLQEDKFFNRMSLYGEEGLNTKIPLKRVVDAAPAESLEGLRFTMLINDWIATKNPEIKSILKKQLSTWSALASDLPLIENENLEDIKPHAIHLKQLSELGLEVIDGETIDTLEASRLLSESSEAYGATLLSLTKGFGVLLNHSSSKKE